MITNLPLSLMMAILMLTLLSGCANRTDALQLDEVALTDTEFTDQRSSFEKAYADIEALSVRPQNRWPVSSYFSTKAWAWVQFAEQEWQERDQSNAAAEALQQARQLLLKMNDSGPDTADLSMRTTHIATSKRIREDLWQQAEGFKRHNGFACAEPEIAELEVTLVHAGHEYQELGWRHARSEVLKAERLAKAIPPLLVSCIAPEPVKACACGADEQVKLLPKYLYFGLDSDQLNQAARRKLDDVVQFMRNWPNVAILLEGHADMLANAFYNLGLSARRAQAVSNYLQLAGIKPERIGVRALGEQQPRGSGCTEQARALDRRVQINYYNAGNIELTEDEIGIEIERIPVPRPGDC